MPAKSKAQLHLLQAVAHNPDFAKKVGIPQTVGKEYSHPASKNLPAHVKMAHALRNKSYG